MSGLSGKRVLLGITGGIAAYKSAQLVRLLRGEGAEVRVVMTSAAGRFIAPMTLQALSGNPVRSELFDPGHEQAMGHIELARWADLVLVAPASADFMARCAAGMADDLLSTLCLASEAPLALAPAMNRAMWEHAATRTNAATLAARGVSLWGPEAGDLACGESGAGRMLEPGQLLARCRDRFSGGALDGLRVLLTAGPTREALDPVRFIGNRSSGKMGFALAGACAGAGARVVLVSGPVALETPAAVERVGVESALEMQREVLARAGECDIFIGCAAVADYRPEEMAREKIKKSGERMRISLIRNPDILAGVAALEHPPFTVGFAAETRDPPGYAEAKRRDKGVDMVAANLVGADRGGFERDENALTLVWEGGVRELAMQDKRGLAAELVMVIAQRYALARGGAPGG
ncbi:MAG: bifunctional phosphopantothenoylcysteine decarboxylase/phosphopantothenate--cysteine ligase CoaBC [Candidatus Sedimenticola endophacoides]